MLPVIKDIGAKTGYDLDSLLGIYPWIILG